MCNLQLICMIIWRVIWKDKNNKQMSYLYVDGEARSTEEREGKKEKERWSII